MKDITISLDDEVYRAASAEAVRLRKSLSELVQELLTKLRAEQESGEQAARAEPELRAAPSAEDEELSKGRENLAGFFAESNASALNGGSAVEPLHREELDRSMTQAETRVAPAEGQRAEFLARLQQLFAQADERDRLKKDPLIPLTREEIYAERLDGFR